MQGTAETIVNDSNTAISMGSGSLPVFATPAMIALMEAAACNAIESTLSADETSVGISIHADHIAASSIGDSIKAVASISEKDGRIITFTIECFAGDLKIGSCIHKRCVVNKEKFMARLAK